MEIPPGAGAKLLHNSGNSNHWIVIKPKGTGKNTSGIGARVRVVAGGLRMIRDIEGSGPGLTSGKLWAHFGLGSATVVDSIIVQWPTGQVEVITNVPADQYYTIQIAPPTITSFSPTSGPIGATVTITGTNFNTTAANNVVYFGAVKAQVTSASSTSLTVIIPVGATYQLITVTDLTKGLTAYSAKPFIVTFAGGGYISSSSFSTKVDFTTGSNPYSLAISDLDSDGKPDLAVSNKSSSTVSVFRNTSTSGLITSASLSAKMDFTIGGVPYDIAIGDLDGDGKPDLAVPNNSSNTVSVFRNTSTSGSITSASFAPKVDFTTGSAPLAVAISDLDGDGKPDLAVANYGSNTVSVFRNTSTNGSITSSSFAAKVDFTTGTGPESVTISDLDGDGKPDLAVANYGSNTVSIFRNSSMSGSITSASFAAKVDFTTGNYSCPGDIEIGDLDGDGKPDLAVANNGSRSCLGVPEQEYERINHINVICNESGFYYRKWSRGSSYK